MQRSLIAFIVATFALAACATAPPPAAAGAFFANLRTLCNEMRRAHEGRLIADEGAATTFAGKTLIMGPAVCTPSQVRIPFAVGEDRSRTWVLTRLGDGRVSLKHEHRHADGSEDALSQYGGDAITPVAATHADFPVDAFTRDLFVRQNIPQSLTNVWTIEIEPGQRFVYQLKREGRLVRV